MHVVVRGMVVVVVWWWGGGVNACMCVCVYTFCMLHLCLSMHVPFVLFSSGFSFSPFCFAIYFDHFVLLVLVLKREVVILI